MNAFDSVAGTVAGYLQTHGYPGARSSPDGSIRLAHAVIVADTHWHARRYIGAAVDRAEDLAAEHAEHAAGAYDAVPAVWHERPGVAAPEDWLVTVTGEQFVQLLAAYGVAAKLSRQHAAPDPVIRYGVEPDPAHRCLAAVEGGAVCIGPAGHDPDHRGR